MYNHRFFRAYYADDKWVYRQILVHAPYYIDGERMQEVEIYLNFIGKFEIPQPQLSEEEIKRQKQLKQPV